MISAIEKTILFRVDANAAIGSGHLMRCLALAEACVEKQLKPIFVLSASSREVSENKALHGVDVQFVAAQPGDREDSLLTSDLAVQNNAAWIVIDGYHFGEAYHHQLKEQGHRILCIDDCSMLPYYHADIVLNQNMHACEDQYQKRSPQTRLLLGSRYVLLRNEFIRYADQKRPILDQGKKILITMGGSDPQNATLEVIKWLSTCSFSDLAIDVVLGPANRYLEAIETFLQQVPLAFRIHRSANNMADLMAGSDLAISSAGTTSWELAYMGVPSLLVSIAENQRPVAEKLHLLGASVYLGRQGEIDPGVFQQELSRLICSPDVRQKMNRIGKEIVDGKGRERVLREMTRNKISLRRVNENDCRKIWEWANDTVARKASFSSEAISWETHVDWFQAKLKDAGCEMYIAHHEDGKQLGQVRFEMDQKDAVISVSLDPSSRNKGYGKEIIAMGTRMILERKDIEQVRAMVKKENIASIRAFEKAAFEKMDIGPTPEERSFCLIYRKPNREKSCI